MIRGLDTFRRYFEDYHDNYIIIGGTACDVIIEDAGLTPRATKDIDIILIVEALSSDFVLQFWQFISDGKYECKEKSEDGRQYYRFMKPENTAFPVQIELFSRLPDVIDLEVGAHLTPIPVDDDLSSLSAILLDDHYYKFIIENSEEENGLHRANIPALICLKAKAFLEITERIAYGSPEDKKQLKKHKADVYRLGVMMRGDEVYDVPESIKHDLQNFMNQAAEELPDKAIYKEMGLGNIAVENIRQRLVETFQLKG